MYVCCMVQRAPCMFVLCSSSVRELHPSAAYYLARCGGLLPWHLCKGRDRSDVCLGCVQGMRDSDSGTMSMPDAAHAHTHTLQSQCQLCTYQIASCTAKTRASSADSTQCAHPGSATLPTLWGFRSNQNVEAIMISCSLYGSIRSNWQQQQQPKINIFESSHSCNGSQYSMAASQRSN